MVVVSPPILEPGTLRIIPLGGLGDVGRNMTVFEIDGQLLIVDCGVLFPAGSQPGVDLILPGLNYLDDRLDDIVALVLTHGHEDHIGAVPYLLKRREDIDIYASKLTLAFLDPKLKEHGLSDSRLHEVREGDAIRLGQPVAFNLEFLAVNHSIPDALAVAIKTAAGTALHTGDFKMDQLPLDGRLTDLRGFGRLGERGVDLLMADSTNAEVPGFTHWERDTGPALERVFMTAQRKIVVACFASHVHRVQQIVDLAAKYDRKVCYMGRSMVRNMAVARDLGYLTVPGDTLIDIDQLKDYDDSQVVVISTGSQGEPLSALSRMASGDHANIEIGSGDVVLLASSLIPGNEAPVFDLLNGLTRLGATVVHKGNAFVHVSGHASQGELLYVYNIVKPRNAMPVHGEVRHLAANAELARSSGLPEDHVIVASDGDVIDLADGHATVVGQVDASYIFVDGLTVGDVSEAGLTDRKILGEEGFISIVAAVDLRQASIVAGPDLHARGFLEDEHVFDDVTEQVRDALQAGLTDGVEDVHSLAQLARTTVRHWVSKAYRARPMIVPVIIAV